MAGVETFGRDDDPLVLLAGGPTMLSWPHSVCERLPAGGQRVVRYDLRDCGASTTADPEALLNELARGQRPLTHEILDQFPPGRSLAHLRAVLVAAGGLPPRNPAAARPDLRAARTALRPEPRRHRGPDQFPGGRPGHPLDAGRISDRLKTIGLHPRAGHPAAQARSIIRTGSNVARRAPAKRPEERQTPLL
jgi:hypothetical protein